MSRNALEEKLYRSRWEDGLLDVFIGLALLAIGISWLNHQMLAGAITPALLTACWPAARKRLVIPRMGAVTFGTKRRGRETSMLRTLALAGVAVFILGTLTYFFVARSGAQRDWQTVLIPALPGVLLAVPAFFAAQALGIQRFHLYGAALLVGCALLVVFETNPGVPMALGGMVALASGTYLLLRFIRTHPVLSDGKAL